MLAQNKERVEGHYEVANTPFASNYVWVVQENEVDGRLLGEILHPWHAAYEEWVKEARAYPELQEQRELEAL